METVFGQIRIEKSFAKGVPTVSGQNKIPVQNHRFRFVRISISICGLVVSDGRGVGEGAKTKGDVEESTSTRTETEVCGFDLFQYRVLHQHMACVQIDEWQGKPNACSNLTPKTHIQNQH